MQASPFRALLLGASAVVAAWLGARPEQAQLFVELVLPPLGLALIAAAADPKAHGHPRPGPRPIHVLAAPIVGGYGRGSVLLVLALGLSLGGYFAGRLAEPAARPLFSDDDDMQVLGAVLLVLCYGLAVAHATRLAVLRSRSSILLAFVVLWTAGVIAGEQLHGREGRAWAWLLTPVTFLAEIRSTGQWMPWSRRAFELLVGLSAVLLLLELPRMVRGVRALARPGSAGGAVAVGDAP